MDFDEHLAELKQELGYKLDTLRRGLLNAIERGYPFANEHITVFARVLAIEASIRALEQHRAI
jgi:hypothetical protein